jgi:ring-1,2-phenylacetyl-CoA epoxidase subunit PaaC
LDDRLKETLGRMLLAMADDELILAHRNSEWTGHAPILEEDIAFSNIAQDELGHATLFYGLLGELNGADPDQLVFFRDADGYRNVQMVELPKGDWAFSMVRQYLFDAFEMVRAGHLLASQYRPLAEAIAKIRQEEMYHYRHTSQWVKRLGLGTEESRRRTQAALETLWPYAHQLFVPLADEAALVTAGFSPDPEILYQSWTEVIVPFLKDTGLNLPAENTSPTGDRREHTAYLPPLLAELQGVARSDPDAGW